MSETEDAEEKVEACLRRAFDHLSAAIFEMRDCEEAMKTLGLNLRPFRRMALGIYSEIEDVKSVIDYPRRLIRQRRYKRRVRAEGKTSEQDK